MELTKKLYIWFSVMLSTAILFFSMGIVCHTVHFYLSSPECTEATQNKPEGCHKGSIDLLNELRLGFASIFIGKAAVIANLHIESNANSVISTKGELSDFWIIGSDIHYTGKRSDSAGITLESPEPKP